MSLKLAVSGAHVRRSWGGASIDLGFDHRMMTFDIKSSDWDKGRQMVELIELDLD